MIGTNNHPPQKDSQSIAVWFLVWLKVTSSQSTFKRIREREIASVTQSYTQKIYSNQTRGEKRKRKKGKRNVGSLHCASSIGKLNLTKCYWIGIFPNVPTPLLLVKQTYGVLEKKNTSHTYNNYKILSCFPQNRSKKPRSSCERSQRTKEKVNKIENTGLRLFQKIYIKIYLLKNEARLGRDAIMHRTNRGDAMSRRFGLYADTDHDILKAPLIHGGYTLPQSNGTMVPPANRCLQVRL